MGFQNLFGTMLLGAAITPRALLPPSCTVTVSTNVPVETGIQNTTLTYSGPFPPGPFVPLQVSLTTYTSALATQGSDGVQTTLTYTIIASPSVVPIPPSSTSTPTPAPPLTTDVPNSTYVGCFEAGTAVLYGPSALLDTQESCELFCATTAGGPFRYFSIRPVSICQCGQSLEIPPPQYKGQCTTGCAGNVTQQCGGPGGDTSVWQVPPPFRPPPGPGGREPSDPGDGVDGYQPLPPNYGPGHKPGYGKPHPQPSPSKNYEAYPVQTYGTGGYQEGEYPVYDDKEGYPTYGT